MGFLFLVIAVSIVTIGGVFMARAADQKDRDQSRKTYRLYFPSGLESERVEAWVRAISGTLRGSSINLRGNHTIAFELWATNTGISHILKVPWNQSDFVISQLLSLVPGTNVSQERNIPKQVWRKAVEVGLTNSSRTLRIASPADMATSILASVQPLAEKEKVVIQWVVTPAVPGKLPVHKVSSSHHQSYRMLTDGNLAGRDEINDRRAKLEEPNVLGVLRVAAAAETDAQAEHLIFRVRNAIASSRGPYTRFVRRFVPKRQLIQRIDQAAGSVVFPIQLAASELSALIAWPLGNPFVSGLAPTRSRHLPTSSMVPLVGRVIGRSNMPGAERPVALDYKHALKHLHVLGPSGRGKTTLLANMLAQDIDQGFGAILIESKGDLFEAALHTIPKHRMDDVIVLDVNDTSRPVGFNILDQVGSRTAVDELISLIAGLYKDSSTSIHAPQVLYHMMHALAEVPGSTFMDLPTMLSPQGPEEAHWRDAISRQVRNKDIRLFLQRYMNMDRREQDRMSAPVHNRTWQFTSRPEIKYILGQRTSSFKMVDVIRDNKILLVNLNGIRVGAQTASLAGTLLVNSVWQAVRTVLANKPNFLYLDEFQDFAGLPVSVEDMLAKSRSARLGTILAHRHLGQLDTELRGAVMANASSKVVFRTKSEDARLMAKEFGGYLADTDFMNLGSYEAIARLETDEGISPAMTVKTLPPRPSSGNMLEVRNLSRHIHGRPIEQVQRDLELRALPQATQKPRPTIGGPAWR